MLSPLPRFWNEVAGGGLRAALMFPRGVEEVVMLAVGAAAPGADRGGDSEGAAAGDEESVGAVGDWGGSEGSAMIARVV